jgi:hypothetical protein
MGVETGSQLGCDESFSNPASVNDAGQRLPGGHPRSAGPRGMDRHEPRDAMSQACISLGSKPGTGIAHDVLTVRCSIRFSGTVTTNRST